MTPTKKAKELIRNFYSVGATECKQCALIAVDEILKVLCTPDKNEYEYMYWQEVKQEIEKL